MNSADKTKKYGITLQFFSPDTGDYEYYIAVVDKLTPRMISSIDARIGERYTDGESFRHIVERLEDIGIEKLPAGSSLVLEDPEEEDSLLQVVAFNPDNIWKWPGDWDGETIDNELRLDLMQGAKL